jgi:hypothetical protein
MAVLKLMTLLLCLGSSQYVWSLPKDYYKSSYRIKNISNMVSRKQLMGSLRNFVNASKPNRFIGTEGHKKARNFIWNFLQKYQEQSAKISKVKFGIDLGEVRQEYEKDFEKNFPKNHPKDDPEYLKWKKFNKYMQSLVTSKRSTMGMNYQWEKKGIKNPDKILILTAHYDTISINPKTMNVDENEKMPGADYNASGVAIGLQLIKILEQIPLENSIRIVFLDYSALGFQGASYHARNLKNEKGKIVGVINLEMLGHDSKVFDKEKKLKNMQVYLRPLEQGGESDQKLLNQFSLLAQKLKVNINFEPQYKLFQQSDSFRYWKQGIPSVTFTQNWDQDFNKKRYQSPNDIPETINQKTYYNAFKYMAISTLGWAMNVTK